MVRATSLLAFLLLCSALCAAPDADAQVQRCETPDGRTVYTDKPCRDINAVERLQRDGAAGQASASRQACARTPRELIVGLTLAIDARDANQLAAFYHWPGIATRAGYAIMDRLDAISRRPLVDVRPLYPHDVAAAELQPAPAAPAPAPTHDPARPPTASELMQRTAPWRPSSTMQADTMRNGTTPADPVPVEAAEQAPRPQRVPHALQVEQTLANSGTPSRTVFGLHRHLGCWWIGL